MTSYSGESVFAALKPLCVAVMSSPSCQNLSSLRAGLQDLSAGILPAPLLPYVLIPLRVAIKRIGTSDLQLLEEVLLTMTAIFTCTSHLDKFDLFHDLYTFLCMLLDKKMAAEAGYGCVSEEMLLIGMQCLHSLFLCTSSSVYEQLYDEVMSIGHCISILLDHASNTSSSHTLRAASLSCLSAFMGLDAVPIMSSVDALKGIPPDSTHFSIAIDGLVRCMEKNVGVGRRVMERVLPSFLPGLVSAITRTVATDANTVTMVICEGLLTWSHCVAMVMCDSEDNGTIPQAKENTIATVNKTDEWVQTTNTHLLALAQHISVLVTNDNWKTRLILAGWAHVLITRCYSYAKGCVFVWVEVLVTLSHDVMPQVASLADHALQRFPTGTYSLCSLLGTQLHTLVSSLPRLIRHHDDTRKVATLQLLAGYLHLAGSHVTFMIHSLPHLTRLMQALLEAMTINVGTQQVLATPLPTLSITLPSSPLHLPHIYFHSDKIATLLKEVCQLLGCRGDLPVLLDYIMDQFHSNPRQRNELLLFLSYMLPGSAHVGCGHSETPPTSMTMQDLCISVEGIVNVLTMPESASPHNPSPLTSDLSSFLFVFFIFTCVHVLGTTFDPLLQQVLYPLMLHMQDESVGVVNGVMATLQSICFHGNYKSVADLIGRNADYLIHTISVQLRTRQPQQQARAIRVLQSVVAHGNEEVCELVQDIIHQLLQLLDTRQVEVWLLWEGLGSLAQSCARWVNERPDVGVVQPEEVGSEKKESEEVWPKQKDRVGIAAIAEFFHNYHKVKKEEEEGVANESMTNGGVANGDDDVGIYSQDEPLLSCESTCVEVLRRCGHHMSHADEKVRLKVLNSILSCLQTLQHNQLVLYPEVHLLWAPLLPRLSDHAHFVARRAWQVMMYMSSVCGEFLRKRILDKVWPLLVGTLETMATESLGADNFYKQSGGCKLQACLLECVGQFSDHLSLPSLSLEDGAITMVAYLHDDQPRLLQDAAVRVAKQLISVDPDVMWLVLSQLTPPTPHPPPHPDLKSYTFSINSNASKYRHNVDSLLPLTMATISYSKT